MKDNAHYTFHLELQHSKAHAAGAFHPKETQLHHYPTVDHAFLSLLTVMPVEFERDLVINEHRDCLVLAAYVTPPFDDTPIAVIKRAERMSPAGTLRPHYMIECTSPGLLSQETADFLSAQGFQDARARELPLLYVRDDGDIAYLASTSQALKMAAYHAMLRNWFSVEIKSARYNLAATETRFEDVRIDTTYTSDLRDAARVLLNTPVVTLHQDLMKRTDNALTITALLTGPYEYTMMMEMYHLFGGEHGIDRLGDTVFLEINSPNRYMLYQAVPELSTLEDGGHYSAKVLATLDKTEGLMIERPSFQALKALLHSEHQAAQHKAVRRSRRIAESTTATRKKP